MSPARTLGARLSGDPHRPRTWSSPPWYREVLTAPAAITVRASASPPGTPSGDDGSPGRGSRPGRRTGRAPTVRDLEWRTTLTPAAEAGRALDLSVSGNGHGAIAYVRHRPGVGHSSVAGASFRVTRTGGIRDAEDTTWRRPVGTTVGVTASAASASVTLGRIAGTFYEPPRTHHRVFTRASR